MWFVESLHDQKNLQWNCAPVLNYAACKEFANSLLFAYRAWKLMKPHVGAWRAPKNIPVLLTAAWFCQLKPLDNEFYVVLGWAAPALSVASTFHWRTCCGLHSQTLPLSQVYSPIYTCYTYRYTLGTRGSRGKGTSAPCPEVPHRGLKPYSFQCLLALNPK